MSEMPIKTIAPWFGNKRTLSPLIVQEMGEHRCYWEPFVGGISVIMVKPPCAMETINDLHGDIVNLARVVQDEKLGPFLYRRLRRAWMCEQLHREAAERWKQRGLKSVDDLDVERAYDYFLCAWLGRNGVAGTQSYNQGFCVRFTANGGHAAKRFCSAVDSIPAWSRRMRNVTILNRDAFALLDRIEDESRTAIYLDPPYVKKGAKYSYDFATADHERLAKSVRRFRLARVVISYYDNHPLVRELYEGWTLVSCPTVAALAQANRRSVVERRPTAEVLLINGPSKTDQAAEVIGRSPSGLFAGAKP
jgi:DNA adenine methylase